MFLPMGESVRVKSESIGERNCAVCLSHQKFTKQQETTWFCLFGIPLLPIDEIACYWCCEKCLHAYAPQRLDYPSAVAPVKRLIVYLLLGYSQEQHHKIANQICLAIIGFELGDSEYRDLLEELRRGEVDIVEYVRGLASTTNGIGKQQILEVAFLATYICCDIQYEDRLRINLIGSALGVGLEFVDYSMQQTRKQQYYGVRRLGHETEV